MQLYIKQRVFSWTDTYDVYNIHGEPRYYVRAEFFSFGHQIHVYDRRTDREVGSIHQKLLAFLPTFEIVINGAVVGTIRREFTFFRPRYHVDFKNWQVEGYFWDWDYSVTDGSREVMTISKQLFSWGDAYTLDFNRAEDEIPGLLLVIAIDAANCNNK